MVCFIGLILYITSPSWYVDFKLSGFTDNEGGRFLEMTRLSAFGLIHIGLVMEVVLFISICCLNLIRKDG